MGLVMVVVVEALRVEREMMAEPSDQEEEYWGLAAVTVAAMAAATAAGSAALVEELQGAVAMM